MGDTKRQIATLLERITNSTVYEFASYDFGRKQNPACVSAIVPWQQAEKYLSAVRAVLPKGYVAFIGINWGFCWLTAKTEERTGLELVIGPGESQFDILKLARPDGDYIGDIEQMQKYDQDFGIDIFLATTDQISFRLLNKPNNLYDFAKDLLNYCPDLLVESEDPLRDLLEYLEQSETISLWWD